jgi:hypothetical protein
MVIKATRFPRWTSEIEEWRRLVYPRTTVKKRNFSSRMVYNE